MIVTLNVKDARCTRVVYTPRDKKRARASICLAFCSLGDLNDPGHVQLADRRHLQLSELPEHARGGGTPRRASIPCLLKPSGQLGVSKTRGPTAHAVFFT